MSDRCSSQHSEQRGAVASSCQQTNPARCGDFLAISILVSDDTKILDDVALTSTIGYKIQVI